MRRWLSLFACTCFFVFAWMLDASATAVRPDEQEIRYQASPGVRGQAAEEPGVTSTALEPIAPILQPSGKEPDAPMPDGQKNATAQ